MRTDEGHGSSRHFHMNLIAKTKLLAFILLLITTISGQALAFNSILLGDYQIQIFMDPDPPVAEKETTVTVKILRAKDYAAAKGGTVLISAEKSLGKIGEDGVELKPTSEYDEMKEADQFGNYEWKTTFVEPDIYYMKFIIRTMEGRPIDKPLAAGLSISVGRPDHSRYRLLFVLIAVLLLTVGWIYIIRVRSKTPSSESKELNLLDIPWIMRLFQSKYFQPAFQVPLLILFVILIILAMFDIQDGGKNIAVILMWTIWWAGVIFTFVLVGRSWCFMCPIGAITEWASRIFKPNRLFPAKLRNVWVANLMFIMLTWLDIQVGVVRNPVVTASLLIGITAVAILIGLLFQRRTFCRYLCPIGGLIGIYSMFSAVELRSKDLEVCRSHRAKDCYLGNAKGFGCPMFEIVQTLDSNNLCNFCGECVKSCPKNNIIIRIRPFFKDAWTTRKRFLDEAALALVLVGVTIFVTGDMIEPWARWLETAMKLFPAQKLGIEYEYTIELITKSILYFSISLLIIPGLMLLSSAISNKMVGEGNHHGLKQTFIAFGYMFIPIGLSMHLAHNTGHLLNESRKIMPALQRAINTFTPFYAGEPNWRLAAEPLVDTTVIYWIQMAFFLILYFYALYGGYRLAVNNYKDFGTAFKALLPMVFLSFTLMIVNVYLLNLPMAPRHVH